MSEIPVFSDLIHRFLDGETSDIEQGLLFIELAKDPQLQTELQQSLTIRTALLTESRNTVIPAALTERVFRGALSPVVSSELTTTVKATATASTLRKFLVVLGSAISGAGLMYLLSTPSLDAMRSTTSVIAPKVTTYTHAASAQNSATNAVAHNSIDLDLESGSEPADRSRITAYNRSHSNIERSASDRGSVHGTTMDGGQRSSASAKDVSTNIDAATSSEYPVGNTSQAVTDGSESLPDAITPVLPHLASLGSLDITRNALDISPVLLVDQSAAPSKQRLHLRALAHATLLQRHGLRATTMLHENIALGYDYNIRPGHFLGFTGGIEYFPLFIEQSQMLSPQLSLLWAGISYAFEPDLFNAGWIRPSAACAVGASTSGPLAKGLVGVRIEPISGISTALHVEFTEVLLRNAGNWYGTQKYNLSYGISASF